MGCLVLSCILPSNLSLMKCNLLLAITVATEISRCC